MESILDLKIDNVAAQLVFQYSFPSSREILDWAFENQEKRAELLNSLSIYRLQFGCLKTDLLWMVLARFLRDESGSSEGLGLT